MAGKGKDLPFSGLEEIFGAVAKEKAAPAERVQQIPLSELHPFEGHPFRVEDDEEMQKTVESVREYGVLTPLIARPDPDGGYEIISGHRRLRASELAGLKTLPVIVRNMDDDTAIICMVDANLQREHILPSERAFAYRMKLEAIKHQGRRSDLNKDSTSGQVVQKWSRDEIADNESGRQVQRYIRLTHLLPELLQKVDEGQIAFTPAVHLSYLSPAEQGWVLDEMERNDCTPSVGQAYHLKEHSMAGTLTKDFVAGLMSQEKANQKERLKIPMERIRKYFPRHYTTAQMEDAIVKMCEAQFRRRTDRDAR